MQEATDNDDWLAKITKVCYIDRFFVFDWILLILMLKSVSAFDADCLHLLLALPYSYQQMAPSKLDQWAVVAFIGQHRT